MDMEIVFKDTRENGTTGGTMRIIVDGYNAPISAGNFVDLVRAPDDREPHNLKFNMHTGIHMHHNLAGAAQLPRLY